LRAKLYKESFEFVRQQRIQCLMQGAWFVNALPEKATGSRDSTRRPNRPWRFIRLVCEPLSLVFSLLNMPIGPRA
jgi:engulfment/cell motility protein 1